MIAVECSDEIAIERGVLLEALEQRRAGVEFNEKPVQRPRSEAMKAPRQAAHPLRWDRRLF
jgi:hypothetical protein